MVELLTQVAAVAMLLHVAMLAVVVWRIWRGETVADRLVGVDLITTLLISIFIILSIIQSNSIYIDLALARPPAEVIKLLDRAGIRVIPTGIDHGTVTAVVAGVPYEITTLRVDVETDGRRAQVAFGTSWQDDAERRDLTINALYATADGTVIDLVGGLADIKSRTVRFIGDVSNVEVLGSNIYNIHHRVAEKWRVGRVMLLGDAAHLITPMWALGCAPMGLK